ncbi:MAG: AAA family ATPase [Turicibacter sp.]|nr:AAA family ATPase [Turicibacter sp.]
MYKTFYSLAREPFPKEVSAKDTFKSSSHQAALRSLDHLKQTRGMGLLTGSPGMGKSLALRVFAHGLNPNLFHCFYHPLSTGTVMDFYHAIVKGLGEEPKYRKVDLFKQIQDGISKMFRERKITPVIILDEMHLARDAFLQELVLLFNFDMDSSNPYILIMAGLPHLKQRLRINAHESLRQRIVAHYEIHPLSIEEAKDYLAHQLSLAGSNMDIFTEPALNAIASRTNGCPRTMALVATSAMMYGEKQKSNQIDEILVQQALENSLL